MVYGLGEKLQEQRLLRKLSQKEVSDALNISASIVSNYESGERTPSVEILMSLARLYHCSVDYLLGMDLKSDRQMIDISMLSNEQVKSLQHFLLSLK